MDILAMFFVIDEFCKQFEPLWNKHLLESDSKIKSDTQPLDFRNYDHTIAVSKIRLSQFEAVLSGLC